MLVDVRTYRVARQAGPGTRPLREARLWPTAAPSWVAPFAYLQAESGDLNTLVHLWAFESADDRARRRAAMMSDPEWQNYLGLADEAGFLIDQRNSLMVPASFAPIRR